MEMRADAAGTGVTRVQKVTLPQKESGPRNEEDLEPFHERTLKASQMLRYAGKAQSPYQTKKQVHHG